MSPRNIIVTVILAAAALGSWYLAQQNSGDDERDETIDPVHRGYYLKSARILGTGPDGKLLYEIQARHAEQQGDDAEAARYFGEALALRREIKEAHGLPASLVALGRLYREQGRLEEARTHLEEATASVGSSLALARAYLALEDMDKAIQQLESEKADLAARVEALEALVNRLIEEK